MRNLFIILLGHSASVVTPNIDYHNIKKLLIRRPKNSKEVDQRYFKATVTDDIHPINGYQGE